MTCGIPSDLRQRRCCFVGYTPEKLNRPPVLLRSKLREAVRREIDEGHTTFVCGLDRGVEIWAAAIVLAERELDSRIKLVCIAPERGRPDDTEWESSCSRIMREADFVQRLHPAGRGIGGAAYKSRWMLDRCGSLIAVYNGSRDGTKQAIDYAVRCRLNVVLI